MGNLNKNIGNLVRRYRLEKNLSTEKLAKKLEVSAGLINNIENANTDTFKLDLLYNLMTELNIPFESIFPKSTYNLKAISNTHAELNLKLPILDEETYTNYKIALTLFNETFFNYIKNNQEASSPLFIEYLHCIKRLLSLLSIKK